MVQGHRSTPSFHNSQHHGGSCRDKLALMVQRPYSIRVSIPLSVQRLPNLSVGKATIPGFNGWRMWRFNKLMPDSLMRTCLDSRLNRFHSSTRCLCKGLNRSTLPILKLVLIITMSGPHSARPSASTCDTTEEEQITLPSSFSSDAF